MLRGIGLLLVSWNALAQNSTPSAEQLFERLSPSIWMVKTFDEAGRHIGTGSAVVIQAGTLITNCHVLVKARKVAVTRENVSYGATLEHADPARDLCQLKVANFYAPPVAIAAETPKVGARVYAIGNPRGWELTISDGLLSGIRRTDNGELVALQITVPISPGSSGGGLFDAQGRLIGITTLTRLDAQNLNFAVPAAWIADVPARAAAALAARSERNKPAAATQAGNAQVFEYRLRDRTTGLTQNIKYRLDRMDGNQLVFNQGGRVERAGGEVVTLVSAIAGEYELAMPPGGWITKTPERGQTWRLRYETRMQNQQIGMDITARATDESTMRIGDREFVIMRVEFTGFTTRGISIRTNAAYTANAWYAPELGRVVRFDAKTRGSAGTTFFLVDEALELFDIRKE
ncbi:serine protease [Polaromonas sp.]|uniref:S1C family serine protease n=1 Tax=Polaromonas sp. TaxID=1869339 RepID=UPI003265A5F3